MNNDQNKKIFFIKILIINSECVNRAKIVLQKLIIPCVACEIALNIIMFFCVNLKLLVILVCKYSTEVFKSLPFFILH